MRARVVFLVAARRLLTVPARRQAATPTPAPGAIGTAVAQTVQVRLAEEGANGRTAPQATDTPLPALSNTPEQTDTPVSN